MAEANNNAWEKYKGDFNCMTDEQIENSAKEYQEKIDDAEEWLEAIASWKAAGKPRREAVE